MLRASCQIRHGRIFSAPVRNQIHWALVSPVLFHMKCWRNGISSKMTQCLLGWRLTLAKLWLFEHASQLLNIPVKCHSVSPLHNTKILNSTFILMWYLQDWTLFNVLSVTEYTVQVLAMYYHIDDFGNIAQLAAIKVSRYLTFQLHLYTDYMHKVL